jgi:predicted kinase
MLKAYVTVGLQASGKSTWARDLLKKEPGKWKRINRDLLRELLDDSVWTPENERFIVRTRDMLMCESLKKGFNIIIDDTNLKRRNFDDIVEVIRRTNLDVHVMEKFFPVELEEAIKRDAGRTRPVGEQVIRDTYKKFGLNHVKNWSCRSETITKAANQTQQYQFNPALPYAILIDLDGTLAKIGNRNVYDATNCDEIDIINEPVARTAELYDANGYKIIFVSGRKDTYEAPTRKFIVKHLGQNFQYQLYMRKSDDDRKDSIIKSEIYDTHIRNKYNPFFIMDDRDQVVEFWRSIGLTCFQVAPGSF